MPDYVDPKNKEPVILEDDPTYCGGKPHEGIEDPELIAYKNRVMWHDYNSDYQRASDSIFTEDYVDPRVDEPTILEDDPTYCAGEDHELIDDPDTIIFKDKVVVQNDEDNYRKVSDSMFLPDHVKPGTEDPIILEDDPTYCGGEDHGVPFESFSIAGLDDSEPVTKTDEISIDEDDTNADIHNSTISTKKRFSSSI